MKGVVLALLVAGCGRIGYDPADLADADPADLPDVDPGQVQFGIVLFNPAAPDADDQVVRDRLMVRGFSVVLIDDDDGVIDLPNGVFIITNSAASAVVAPGFATVPNPVITLERSVLDTLLMASASGETTGETDIDIANIDHPMRAGLTPGTQVLLTATSEVGHGIALATADVIGTMLGNPVLFVYDTGDTLLDGTAAPSCRIAFPGGADTSPLYTDVGFALFDAAIDYAAACL